MFNRFFGFTWLVLTFAAVFLQRKLILHKSWLDVAEYTTLACLLYLIYNSRSLRSRSAYLLYAGVGLFTAGYLLRFIRWGYVFEFQVAGTLLISIGYALFFLRHQRFSIVDILKLIWILIAATTFLWIRFRLPSWLLLERATLIAFWPMYLSVCLLESRGRDQSQDEEEEPEMPDDVL